MFWPECKQNIQLQDPKGINIRLETKIFDDMDINNQQKLTNQTLTAYFKDFAQSSVKLMMNAMDFDNDGVITRAEWFGYWQYIRRAGYN